MKPETTEWLDKAEGDWKVAQREMLAPDLVMRIGEEVRKAVRLSLGLP